MRVTSVLRQCYKLMTSAVAILLAIGCLRRAFDRAHQADLDLASKGDGLLLRQEVVRTKDEGSVLTDSDNEVELGTLRTLWANLSVLTGDVTMLKQTSLLYRVNVPEVNKNAVLGAVFSYIPHLLNPCWQEHLTSSHPYKNNPFPAIKQDPFKNLQRTFHRRLQRHPANATRTRCLPYFYVIGASKSGTTDFFENLIRHENIAEPAAKEPTWWNARLGGSGNARFKDYIDLFDVAAEQIWRNWKTRHTQTVTGEATPSYCYDNDGWRLIRGNRKLDEPRYGVPHVIRDVTPDARIILLLRDPVERVYSHYRNVKPFDKPEVFHDHVVRAVSILSNCFRNRTIRSCFYDPELNRKILPLHLRASLYPVMLHDWLTVFSRDQFLVIKAESYFRSRVAVLNTAYRFLGLADLPNPLARAIDRSHVINDKRKRGVSGKPMLLKTRRLLEEFLKPFNDRVRQLLGDEFVWTSQ